MTPASRAPRVALPPAFIAEVKARAAALDLAEYRDLAARAGVSPSSVTRFYRNQASAEIARKLAAVVDVPLPVLGAGVDPTLDRWLDAGRGLRELDPAKFDELLESLSEYVGREAAWARTRGVLGLRR